MWQIFSILLLYGASIGGALYLTKRFKEVCPEYKGKILWTLFFFPLYFILGMFIGAINPFITSNDTVYSLGPSNSDILTSIVVAIFGVGAVFFFIKELKFLKTINIENINQIKKYANLTLITACVGMIIAALLNFVQGITQGDSFTGALLLAALVISLIWYFTNKKIEYFRKLLSGELYEVQNSVNFAYNNPSIDNFNKNESIKVEIESSKEKLYKLKELLDKGILTQEEFDSMKKDILEKGI